MIWNSYLTASESLWDQRQSCSLAWDLCWLHITPASGEWRRDCVAYKATSICNPQRTGCHAPAGWERLRKSCVLPQDYFLMSVSFPDYAFPYIILVLSLVTLAVYMSASEIENCYDLLVRKKRLIVLFSHWLLHAYGIVSISRVDRLEHDLPLLALVPTPALFYLFTAKFTEPSRILSEGANGHWI